MKKTKIIKGIILSIVILIVGYALLFLTINRKEFKTMGSFKKEEAKNMYSMTYYSDYYFDEYMETGYTADIDRVNFMTKHVMHGMIPISTAKPANCSVFVCNNEKGEVMYCRNFDAQGYSPCCMTTMQSAKGYKSICGTELGAYVPDADNLKGAEKLMLLAAPYCTLDGMNEYGLAMAILSTGKAQPPQEEDAIVLTEIDALRAVLDNARTVDEAVDYMKNFNYDMGKGIYFSPVHYMLADSTGKSVVVEFSEGEIVTVETPYVTNFNLYDKGNGIGQERYYAIEKVYQECNGVMTQDEALKLLTQVVMPGKEQYSVIYNLTTGEVTAFGMADPSVTAEFELALK